MAWQINGTTVLASTSLTNIANQNSFVQQGISDAYDNGTMHNPYVGAIAFLFRTGKTTERSVVSGSELRFGGVTTGVVSFPDRDEGDNSDMTAGPAGSIVGGSWYSLGRSNSTYTYSSGDVQTYDLGYTLLPYIRYI